MWDGTDRCRRAADCNRLLKSTEHYRLPADRDLLIAAGNPPSDHDSATLATNRCGILHSAVKLS